MWWLILFFVAMVALLCWASCAIGGKADEQQAQIMDDWARLARNRARERMNVN